MFGMFETNTKWIVYWMDKWTDGLINRIPVHKESIEVN